MDTFSVNSRRYMRALAARAVRGSCVLALLSLALALPPPPVISAEKPANKPGEAWPVSVQASYRLSYNGIKVGRLTVSSSTTANSYSVSGSGKVSVLFGKFKWWGSSSVSGTIEGGDPAPTAYSFNWHQKRKKKNVAIRIGYEDRAASAVAVDPPPRARADTVPLAPAHRHGTLDPLSSIMMLTKADSRPPCDRRVGIFDGTQRYDIVFTPKRLTRLPPLAGRGSLETAYVCRITYEPVAGHRANADTRTYASNRDVEIVLRRIPGTKMLIPYSLTIPTAWGTGSMVTERLEIVTAGAGKMAFTP